MSVNNLSKTFESSSLMERIGQPAGTVVASILLAGGISNCVDEYFDVQRASNNAACVAVTSQECNTLVDREQEDALRSSVGGMFGTAMLAGLTYVISRRKQPE